MEKNNTKNLEILSPAGSPAGFFASINAGADAVYLGLSTFNARIKAENFDTKNIREYVKFAHTFKVKVYVTINTLISDDEFDELIKLVKTLTEAKVDAFIVQDLGVFYTLSKLFKNIVIHTSTQMGVHNKLGAAVAQKLGAKRVVLSRETKLFDIKQIHSLDGLEIEYFVQGALCVAFSGNCYLSAIEKNKSGNEGKCLQLCRLPYYANNDYVQKYYLSARDLCLLDSLDELINAGVTSFKIEGRLRHPGYAATATKAYKTALCSVFNSPLTKKDKESIKNSLLVSFSRGSFNERAYLDDEPSENIINKDYQNHIGKKIGTVTKVEPFKNGLYKVTTLLCHNLASGDGLKIIDTKNKKQVASLGVGNIEKTKNGEYIFYTKHSFSSGLDVHLTQNSASEQALLNQKRKLDIDVVVEAFSGKPLCVEATCKNVKVTLLGDFDLQQAETKPLDNLQAKTQFEKLSETPFVLSNFEFKTDSVFVPKSELNNMRRLMCEQLQQQLIENHEKNQNVIFDEDAFNKIKTQKPTVSPKNIVIFNENTKNLQKNDSIFVYSPSVYLLDDIAKKAELYGENFALELPTILNYQDAKIINQVIEKLPNIYLYANNIYGLYYSTFLNKKVIASPLLNIKNTLAIKCLNSLGVNTICASIEAADDFVFSQNLVGFGDGKFPLMTFAHCPYKTINQNKCKNCLYSGNLKLQNDAKKEYIITRKKLVNCQFELNCLINKNAFKYQINNLKA